MATELTTATPAVTAPLPPVATRARTVTGREDATVCVAGSTYARPLAHTVTADGHLLVVVPDDGPVALASLSAPRGHLPGMLVVTDICPVGVADRVRGSVWLSGRLSPVPPAEVATARLAFAECRPVGCLLDVGGAARLLELHLGDVVLSDPAGTIDVPTADFLAARADPLAADEAGALRHLDAAHGDIVAALARRIPGPAGGCVRPVALDTHGLTLRVAGTRSGPPSRDVRFGFAPPLRHIGQLGDAVRRLIG